MDIIPLINIKNRKIVINDKEIINPADIDISEKHLKDKRLYIIDNDGILKYKPNGFYTEHIDTSPMSPRVLSLSLVLNDGFTGGEFSFFGGKYKVSLKKGSAIMFPSNFMYPHAVLPIQKGVRYSIVTWYN